jgi:hypothetical protein
MRFVGYWPEASFVASQGTSGVGGEADMPRQLNRRVLTHSRLGDRHNTDVHPDGCSSVLRKKKQSGQLETLRWIASRQLSSDSTISDRLPRYGSSDLSEFGSGPVLKRYRRQRTAESATACPCSRSPWLRSPPRSTTACQRSSRIRSSLGLPRW